MWVTPNRLLNEGPTIFLELSTFKHQTNNAFRSVVILTMVLLKTEKRPVLTTNRFSLQAGTHPKLTTALIQIDFGFIQLPKFGRILFLTIWLDLPRALFLEVIQITVR